MEENPWKTLSKKSFYDNKWLDVTEHRVIDPNGNDGIYGVIHFKNLALGILPLDNDLNTWLVGQYRYPLGKYSWEIPEGGGALDTDPLESAKRELLEEAGIRAGKWTQILESNTTNSATDELAILYIAQDLAFKEPNPDSTEKLALKKLPFNDAYKMVIDGEIMDALSIMIILRVKILIDEGDVT